MNKHILILIAAALMISGCSYQRSEGLNAKGQVTKAIFPDREEAWPKEGIFPNMENLRQVQPGVTKDDLYYLIGMPHFSEAQHASEWDYLLKFRQPDDSIKVCQFKVIFDDQMKGQSFFWQPADCSDYLKPTEPEEEVEVVKEEVEVIFEDEPEPESSQVITLSADALFAFNQSKLSDVMSDGMDELESLADELLEHQDQERLVEVEVLGHTDRLGRAGYNMVLSQQRADTIREFLIQRGVDATSITARGLGEARPVKQCFDESDRQALIECLAPNRRVNIMVELR